MRWHCACGAPVVVAQLFVILNITVMPMLLVFYEQGANPNSINGLAQLSLSNILNQSTVIWVSLAALFWVTLVTFFLCWRHTGARGGHAPRGF